MSRSFLFVEHVEEVAHELSDRCLVFRHEVLEFGFRDASSASSLANLGLDAALRHSLPLDFDRNRLLCLSWMCLRLLASR